MSLFMKFEPLFLHKLKIIGKGTWLSAEFCLYFMNIYARNNFQSKTSLARYYCYHLFLLQI